MNLKKAFLYSVLGTAATFGCAVAADYVAGQDNGKAHKAPLQQKNTTDLTDIANLPLLKKLAAPK